MKMNDAMIERWNEVVPKDGIVFHLGDFTLGADAAYYMRHLNGTIYILALPWHHDMRWSSKWVGEGFYYDVANFCRLADFISPLSIVRCTELELTITLSHYPMRECDKSHYGAWHLHGHSHGKLPKHNRRMVDVGVDCWDFYPVSFAELQTVMEHRE